MEDRIARLENKIDKLTEAIITLATVQEKVGAVADRTSKNEDHIIRLWTSHREVAEKLSSLQPLATNNAKGLWFIATSAVAVISASAGALASSITSFFTK